MLSAICFNLDQSKILSSGYELMCCLQLLSIQASLSFYCLAESNSQSDFRFKKKLQLVSQVMNVKCLYYEIKN